MNKKTLIIPGVFLSVLTSAFAATTSSSWQGAINYIVDILNIPIKMPRPMFEAVTVPVPLWLIIASFALVFSVIFPIVGRFPFFNDNMGARKAFALAFTAIAVFVAPVAEWMSNIIGGFTYIAMGVFFIVGIYFIYALARKGQVHVSGMTTEASLEELEQERKRLEEFRRPLRRLSRLEFKKMDWKDIEDTIRAAAFTRTLSVKRNKKAEAMNKLNEISRISERMGGYTMYLSSISRDLTAADQAQINTLIRDAQNADTMLTRQIDNVKSDLQRDMYPEALNALQMAADLDNTSQSAFLKLKKVLEHLTEPKGP